jgi:hypothetical protein
MDDTFRNPFAGEVSERFYQLGVLKKRESAALLVADLDCGVGTRERPAFHERVVWSSWKLN